MTQETRKINNRHGQSSPRSRHSEQTLPGVMYSNMLIARIVGVLFIVGTVAGILSLAVTGPILNSPDFLGEISTSETRIITGSLLVLVMAVSLSLIPVVLFPIFRGYNEIIALAAVVFRGVLEAVLYIAIAVSWLLLVVVGRETAGASASQTASLLSLGTLLQGAEDWSAHILSIVFSLGALMIYWLFYTSRLIPRWLAVWGLLGGVLYLITPLLGMFGFEQFRALMAPLAVQEMILAIWLIIKGFNCRNVVPSVNEPLGVMEVT